MTNAMYQSVGINNEPILSKRWQVDATSSGIEIMCSYTRPHAANTKG